MGLKSLRMDDKDPFMLPSQHYDCHGAGVHNNNILNIIEARVSATEALTYSSFRIRRENGTLHFSHLL